MVNKTLTGALYCGELDPICPDQHQMTSSELIKQIIASYQKHGWQLQGALMRPETRAAVAAEGVVSLAVGTIQESVVDALWFSRPSHARREAWELRLISETPYALLEVFEPEEPEAAREGVRREMEARLREYLGVDLGN